MKKQSIAFALSLIHLWVSMILFGAIVFETWIVYPNIFHDIPRSFEVATKFMAVRGPHDFFPPVGLFSMIVGLGSLIFNWGVKSSRYWILGSVLIMLVFGYLLSAAYFWPRNTIMFVEGPAVHSVAFLKQTALEFEIGHWLIRVAGCAASSALSFIGFLKIYRHRITSGNHQYGG